MPTRSSPVQTTCSVETPASRARLAISLPKGLFVRRDTQAVEWPRRARPTAVFNSAPPTRRSRLAACSNRRKLGGLSRIMASPKVMTSFMSSFFNRPTGWGPLFLGTLQLCSRALNDGHVLTRQLANLIKLAARHGLGINELTAD